MTCFLDRTLTPPRLILTGRVLRDGEAGDGFSASGVKQQLDKVSSTRELHLHLNSDGGNSHAGFLIYDLLRNHKGGVSALVINTAASAATIILCGCRWRFGERGTKYQIHGCHVSPGTRGTIDRKYLSADNDQAVAVYDRVLNLAAPTIRVLMRGSGLRCDARTAKAINLIQGILR